MFNPKYEFISLKDHIPQLKVTVVVPTQFYANILKIKHEYIKSREVNGDEFIGFENKVLRLTTIALTIDETCDKMLAGYYAWSVLNLGDVYLLLIDSGVREIFSNKIGSFLVVKHEKYTHCQTNLRFTEELWGAIKLQSEINSNRIISYLSPTLKTGVSSAFGNMRITLQQPPLTIESPSFVIRRLPKIPVLLDHLVDQNQISFLYGDILLSLLAERKNIIIAGEPGSGKTTLANALLLETSPYWRTIIMEDASEIQLAKDKFPLAQHYSIPSFDYQRSTIKRDIEITKLLHRSPDYVFLGEIQTKQDTESVFEIFAAGIRGMATTHARNYESLISRWTVSHHLSEQLLSTLDALVITKRELSSNRTKLWVSDLYLNISGQFKKISENTLTLGDDTKY